MDLHKLKTFRTVAVLENFNQAAQTLHYAQSTVSSQIKTLEEEIGAPLFDRIGRRVMLTEAGEKMLQYTHRLLAIEEEALAEVAGRRQSTSLLALRAPQTISTYHLPSALADFQKHFPQVRLDISSCAHYALEHELRIGMIDLAFLLTESIQAANLNAELLRTESLIVVAPPDDPLASKKQVWYRELRDRHLFLPKADCGYRMAFEQALVAEKIESATVTDLNSIEAIKKCVMAGLGLTVIPEIAVRAELDRKDLIRLDWAESMETGVLMIWHKDKWISRALDQLMNCVRRVLASS